MRGAMDAAGARRTALMLPICCAWARNDMAGIMVSEQSWNKLVEWARAGGSGMVRAEQRKGLGNCCGKRSKAYKPHSQVWAWAGLAPGSSRDHLVLSDGGFWDFKDIASACATSNCSVNTCSPAGSCFASTRAHLRPSIHTVLPETSLQQLLGLQPSCGEASP